MPDLPADVAQTMPDPARPWEWYAELTETDEQLLTVLERRRPYAYRGTGEDLMLGSYGDPLLDAGAL